MLQDYLRVAGYETEHVSDGPMGLDRLLKDPPDLTLLDIMLPGMDGLAVLREARAHTHRPVILITARIEEVDRLPWSRPARTTTSASPSRRASGRPGAGCAAADAGGA